MINYNKDNADEIFNIDYIRDKIKNKFLKETHPNQITLGLLLYYIIDIIDIKDVGGWQVDMKILRIGVGKDIDMRVCDVQQDIRDMFDNYTIVEPDPPFIETMIRCQYEEHDEKRMKPYIENGFIKHYPNHDIEVLLNASVDDVNYKIHGNVITIFDDYDRVINEYELDIPELNDEGGIYIDYNTIEDEQIYIYYKFYPSSILPKSESYIRSKDLKFTKINE